MVLTERLPASVEARSLAFLLLTLILVSAAWVESDAYRYSALVLFLYGMVSYVRSEPKPVLGWMYFVCVGWSLYVLFRMAADYEMSGGSQLGTSEGIYLFPAAYATIAYPLARRRAVVERCVWLFIAISFAALLVTVPDLAVFDRARHDFLFTDNTIHSSLCGGMIVFAALNFAGYVWRRDHKGAVQRLWLAVAYLTALLCAIGIYGAKSKGVWFALGVAIFAQLLLLPGGRLHARGFAAGAAMLIALASFVVIKHDDIWASIGPSVEATAQIISDAAGSGSLIDAVQDAVASGAVPFSMNERLMLWANAIETWSHDIVFGNGIGWEQLFRHAHYETNYNILHNGYLEIAVRYGLVGLAFYAVLFAWCIRKSYEAWKQGVIAREAFTFHLVSLVFFLATLLTNSNSRLAIGESYMMAACAFGFYCHFRMQRTVREADASRV